MDFSVGLFCKLLFVVLSALLTMTPYYPSLLLSVPSHFRCSPASIFLAVRSSSSLHCLCMFWLSTSIPSAFDVPMQHFSCNLIAPSLLTCPNHLNLPPWISSHRSTISVLCCCCWVIVNRQRKRLAQRCVHLSRGQLITPEYVAPESRDWMWWRMACRKTPRNSLRRRLELCSGLGERYYFHAPKSN